MTLNCSLNNYDPLYCFIYGRIWFMWTIKIWVVMNYINIFQSILGFNSCKMNAIRKYGIFVFHKFKIFKTICYTFYLHWLSAIVSREIIFYLHIMNFCDCGPTKFTVAKEPNIWEITDYSQLVTAIFCCNSRPQHFKFNRTMPLLKNYLSSVNFEIMWHLNKTNCVGLQLWIAFLWILGW